MMKVGLTGGIGSGKSTVAKYFQELGVPVYIADTEAKQLMSNSKSLKKSITEAFGTEAYINNQLNKPFIAQLIFNDKVKLKEMNAIVHPAVAKHFLDWTKTLNTPYCIQENAIIYENNKADEFDFIISVTAPLDVRLKRVLKRDTATKKQVMDRINNQWEQLKKDKLADYVIENTDLDQTKRQVEFIHNKLLKRALDLSIS